MKRSFKNYGKIDVSGFKKIIEENNFDWNEFQFRQKKYDVHKETKTIPILFDPKFGLEAKQTKYYNLFKTQIDNINTHLKEIIEEEGDIFRAILVILPKGKDIATHKDKGESLAIPRRIHIPIITNKDCFFTVGETTKNMKEGEIWEIDNSGQNHSVSNKGETDRIHLIVDFLRK
jgi:quercetin dioxygenase-like cupin family protein